MRVGVVATYRGVSPIAYHPTSIEYRLFSQTPVSAQV
jgi:hypothetical protein